MAKAARPVGLVTGAANGIGRAIARELAREGARLLICARRAEPLEAARAAIAKETNATVECVTADVSRVDELHRLADEATRRFGRIDVLVTNAGGPPAGPFEKHGWDVWQETVDLTLRSVVELTRAVLPGMKERRWGRIINVSSIAAKQPVDNLMLSNSIRVAVTGFARTLAMEVASHGVTVNNILSGYTRTERVEELAVATAARDGVTPADIMKRIESEIPARRLAEPEELGALAAFLASERASYITGQSIAIDGGWIKALM
jgi:3-oxoacyl-[acyl-carrier protein] reductase